MNKNLSIAALLGGIGIILGAFGAHALKEKLGVEALKTFETGVRYQMYHVFALLFVNSLSYFTNKTKNWISIFFIIGILLFSGSLYAISAGNIDSKSIWFITPLGGLLFVIGWLLMFYKLTKK